MVTLLWGETLRPHNRSKSLKLKWLWQMKPTHLWDRASILLRAQFGGRDALILIWSCSDYMYSTRLWSFICISKPTLQPANTKNNRIVYISTMKGKTVFLPQDHEDLSGWHTHEATPYVTVSNDRYQTPTLLIEVIFLKHPAPISLNPLALQSRSCGRSPILLEELCHLNSLMNTS